jgi:16S rRNA (adenine(1408)-N(1))-methyltransferase
VIGIDPDASSMADSSRRAAASARKGGLANAIFLVGAADDLPGRLCGRADEVTIALPWGSLLRGVLTADQRLLGNVGALLKSRGEIVILVSATDGDAAAGGITLSSSADAQELGCRLDSGALQLVECRLATKSDVDRLSSGWGKRLGIPAKRQAWLFRLRRKA